MRKAGLVMKEKGLRLFSSKVCEKVEAKKTTTYNEVADELVAEFSEDATGGVVDSVCYDLQPFFNHHRKTSDVGSMTR
jgi:hypothetical protein